MPLKAIICLTDIQVISWEGWDLALVIQTLRCVRIDGGTLGRVALFKFIEEVKGFSYEGFSIYTIICFSRFGGLSEKMQRKIARRSIQVAPSEKVKGLSYEQLKVDVGHDFFFHIP